MDTLKRELKEEESHDSSDSSDPDEEGSDEGEDYDFMELKEWTFSKLRNLPTQARCPPEQTVDQDERETMMEETKQELKAAKESKLEIKQSWKKPSKSLRLPKKQS